MNGHPTITLTTDFGSADGTVGAMIGVIRSICPEARVVSVTSGIPAHDVPRGAWALLQSAPFFPPDTIHVAVVDPGVGGGRRGVLVRTDHGSYIGPDNGVLSWVLRKSHPRRIYALENPSYRIAPVGVTFDGRDLFAPAAAYLAKGVDPASFGPRIDHAVELPWPQPLVAEDRIDGEIVVIDHFGNLITNIPIEAVGRTFADREFDVFLLGQKEQHRAPVVHAYEQVADGLGALINGAGLIEIACRERSAADATGCGRGDRVILQGQENDK